MKACTKCSEPKPLGDFQEDPRYRDGRRSWCKLCTNRYANEWWAKDPEARREQRALYRQAEHVISAVQDRRRSTQAWLDSLKDGLCTDCGRTFEPCCMDFDHVRGEKFKGVGGMFGCSQVRVLAEIAKCELVCACCHRIRTFQRKPKGVSKAREKINELKAHPCVDCGFQFPPVAMDFDHVRGTKTASIGRMASFTWSRVVAEVAKCDLVCACCHRIRTRTRRFAKAA